MYVPWVKYEWHLFLYRYAAATPSVLLRVGGIASIYLDHKLKQSGREKKRKMKTKLGRTYYIKLKVNNRKIKAIYKNKTFIFESRWMTSLSHIEYMVNRNDVIFSFPFSFLRIVKRTGDLNFFLFIVISKLLLGFCRPIKISVVSLCASNQFTFTQPILRFMRREEKKRLQVHQIQQQQFVASLNSKFV